MSEVRKSRIQEPNEKQKRLLGVMLQNALLEIRVIGWNGEAERAADLADAFHTLPTFMFTSEFDWELFKGFLETYQSKYPRKPLGPFSDYLAFLVEIEKAEGKSL